MLMAAQRMSALMCLVLSSTANAFSFHSYAPCIGWSKKPDARMLHITPLTEPRPGHLLLRQRCGGGLVLGMEGEGIGITCPQQTIVAADDVVEIFRLCVPRGAAAADAEVVCSVVETEADEPEGAPDDEETIAFDASRAVFRSFTFDDCQQVVIREVQYHMLGYGHTVWEAGIALAAWLRLPAQEQLLRNKELLELGCGCALPGIATAKQARACAVSLSDMGGEGGEAADPSSREGEQPWELLANVRYNAAVNCATQLQGVDDATVASFKGPGEAAVIPAVLRLDWSDALRVPDYAATCRRFPVVVGSDLLYESAAIAPLVAAVCAHLVPGGIFIMMAPADEELSRTKLVADFVAALRGTRRGHVDIAPLRLDSYDGYQSSAPSSQHRLQCITFSTLP